MECLLEICQETAERHGEMGGLEGVISVVEACHEPRSHVSPLRWRAALRRSSRLMRFGLGAGGVEGVSLVFAGFGASA